MFQNLICPKSEGAPRVDQGGTVNPRKRTETRQRTAHLEPWLPIIRRHCAAGDVERCGFLVRWPEGRDELIWAANLNNRAESAFEADLSGLLEALASGAWLQSIIHSHVRGDSRWSRRDLDGATVQVGGRRHQWFPGVEQVVCGEREGRWEISLYEFQASRGVYVRRAYRVD